MAPVYSKPQEFVAVVVGEEELQGRELLVNPGEVAMAFSAGRSELDELPPGRYALQSLRDRLTGHGPVQAAIADSGPLRLPMHCQDLRTADGAQVDVDCEGVVQVTRLPALVTSLLKESPRLTREQVAEFLRPEVHRALARCILAHTLLDLAQDIALKDKFAAEIDHDLRDDVDHEKTFGVAFTGVRTYSYRSRLMDPSGKLHDVAILASENEARERGLFTVLGVVRILQQGLPPPAPEAPSELPEPSALLPTLGPSPHERRIHELIEKARQKLALADLPKWRSADLGTRLSAALAAGEGMAWVGTHDGKVLALDLQDGGTHWQSQPLGVKIEGGLAHWKGFVVAPCSDGSLALLDMRDGHLHQRWRVGDELRAVPLIHGDTAYVGVKAGEQGEVRAVFLETGHNRAPWKLGGGIKSTPLLWHNLLLAASRDGKLYAFDAGRYGAEPVWTFSTRNQVLAAPVLDDKGEHVLIGSCDGAVYALDQHKNEAWPPYRTTTKGQIVSSCAVAGGRAFVGNSDGELHALDIATGKPAWAAPHRSGGPIVVPPVVWGGLVFAGSNDGHLYCLDAADGREHWKLPVEGMIQTAPSVTHEGLVLFGAHNGEHAWAYAVPWHNNLFTPMAVWAESRQDWATAGELWARAGEMDKAVQNLMQGGHAIRAAELAESNALYDHAAQGWEALARGSGLLPADSGLIYIRSAQAWGRAADGAAQWRCLKESARLRNAPLLKLHSSTENRCILGDCVTLVIEVRNEGSSPAHEVVLEAGGPIRQLRRIDVGTVREGATVAKEIEVDPTKSGSVRAALRASYKNARRQPEEPAECQVSIQVQRPAPRTDVHIHTGVEIAGDGVVSMRGGAAAGVGAAVSGLPGITIGGDGVILFRGGAGTAAGMGAAEKAGSPPAPARTCPHCASAIRSDARFCPNCGRALHAPS